MFRFDNISNKINGPLNSSNTPNMLPFHNSGVLNGVRQNPMKFYPSDTTNNFSLYRKEFRNVSNNIYNSIKYIPPQSCSMFISSKKRNAIGKSSFNQTTINNDLSYKSYNTNDVKQSLNKVRNRGYVAPKKKGYVY